MDTPARFIRTFADLRAEIAHRRTIACETVGPLSIDLVEQLLDAAAPAQGMLGATSGYAQIGGSLLADTRFIRSRRNQAEEEWERGWTTYDHSRRAFILPSDPHQASHNGDGQARAGDHQQEREPPHEQRLAGQEASGNRNQDHASESAGPDPAANVKPPS